MSRGWLGATYQDRGRSEEVAEGVVEEVEEGGGVEVGVAHELAGKEGLARATAEEAAHLPVAHVHLVRDFLRAWQDSEGTQCPSGAPRPSTPASWDGTPGSTWMRRLMELMSGRSLLLLSRCLQGRNSAGGLSRGSPRAAITRLAQPVPTHWYSSARTRSRLRSSSNSSAKVMRRAQRRRRPPLPSTGDPTGAGVAMEGGRRLQAPSPVAGLGCSPRQALLTALLRPDLQLPGQLRHHQEGAPALPLLGLEDVPEDVVPHVEDVLALHSQQVTHHV